MLATLIRRPIGASFIALAVVLLGLVSFDRLPVRLLPDVEPAVITVVVDWPGHGPERVEDLVLKEMEHQLGTLSGITNMEGQAALGRALLRLTFQADQGFDESLRQVRERLGYTGLPRGASVPVVLGDTNVLPALTFAISSTAAAGLPVASLAVQDELVPLLEGLDGVAHVRLRGIQERELLIEPDPAVMRASGLGLEDLAHRLEDAAFQRTLGQVMTEAGRSSVSVHGGLRRLSDLDTLVLAPNLVLKDLASWRFQDSIPDELAIVDLGTEAAGQQALVMEVVSQGTVSLIEVSAQVRDVMDRYGRLVSGSDGHLLSWELPGANAVLIEDRSVLVSNALGGIQESIVVGGLISLAVLLLFLRQIRPSGIVFMAVPMSVIATFLVMSWAGVSVNLLSLTGLALGIGMLVDNAIVVIESASRAIRESADADDRQWYGRLTQAIGSVAPSVVASTLTTLAVFLPLTMLPGELGDLLFDQSFTICASLTASLVVALGLVPPLVAWRPTLGRTATTTSVLPLRCMGFELVGLRRRVVALALFFAVVLVAALLGAVKPALDRIGVDTGMALTWPGLIALTVVLCLVQVLITLRQSLADGTRSWKPTQDGMVEAAQALPSWSAMIRSLPFWVVLAPAIIVMALFRRLCAMIVALVVLLRRLGSLCAMPVVVVWDAMIGGMERGLDRALAFLTHRAWLCIVILLVPIGIIALVTPQLPIAMLPSVPVQRFSMTIDMPEQGDLVGNVDWLKAFQAEIRTEPGAEGLVMLGTVGGRQQQDQAVAPGPGRVELLLVRSVAWPDIHQQERWMALLEYTALQLGAQTASVRADSPLAIGVEEGADLSLVLRGRDEVTLVHQAERLAAAARAMGAGGVELSSAGLRPSVLIEPNDLFLSERGISLAALRSQVAGSIQSYELEAFRPIWKGESASPYTLPIRLRAPLAEQGGGDLATIPISDSRELGHLSTITSDRRAAVIEHRNGLTATTISIQRLPEGSDSARFLSDLREFAPLPASVELLDQGVDERASSGMQLLLMSFALSVFLVFVVMTAQFESLIQPLLVMISVPLSVAGALLMLWLSGSGIDGMSAIGMIILAGIAVNNAIVLVTTYNLRPESDDHLAARRATVLRLRPILMTTCTTVCSLIPMLLGSDPMSAVRQPLALALIGGLVFSAVLVVIALPALLVLVRRPRLAEKEQPHGASTFSAPALASP